MESRVRPGMVTNMTKVTNMPRETDMKAALAALAQDPDLSAVAAIALRPNMFKILGRTHTETWHSMFLAWLLNPAGSHGLGLVPLSRFCLLAAKAASPSDAEHWHRLAIEGEFDDATEVYPSEFGNGEHIYKDKCRADVRISGIRLGIQSQRIDTPAQRLTIVIEEKIDAPINCEQLTNYIELESLPNPNPKMNPVIYALVAPQASISKSSPLPIGWTYVTLQELIDGLVSRLVSHPGLSSHARFIMEDYMKNLGTSTGQSGVIDPEVKRLANALFERHKNAFALVGTALQAIGNETNDEGKRAAGIALLEGPGKAATYSISYQGEQITGSTGRELILGVLTRLNQDGKLDALDIPWDTSPKRFFINYTPIHPTGKNFLQPLEFAPKKWFIEMNRSRESTLAYAQELIDLCK